jgi:hypothetical protein
MLVGLLPVIPSSLGKHAHDLVQLIPASVIHWSQEGVSVITRNTPIEYLDDLAQDIAQGWKGNPLEVLEIKGKLVSLDNRRLTVAKLLDIDVPVTITKGFSLDDLQPLFRRDGIFNQVQIKGTDLIIDMFGRLKGLSR